MWNHITAPKGSTFTLLKGCKTLLYPILAMSMIVSLLTNATGEGNYKMPWTSKEQERLDHVDFAPSVTRTIAKDQPFCVWFGYDFCHQPSSQLCHLVQDTAEQYITDGKLVVIDSRWKDHVSIDLEDLEDPLASDYEGFNWSTNYGSNSGNVLTHCEDLSRHMQADAAGRRYN